MNGSSRTGISFAMSAFVVAIAALAVHVRSAEPREASPCKIYNDMMTAQENYDKLRAALNSVQISADLEKRILGLALKKIASLSLSQMADLTLEKAYELVQDDLTLSEKAQLVAYFAARKATEAAEKNATAANTAYAQELARSRAALDKATEKFKQEKEWLEQEKKSIESIARDGAYLDRVSKITERLKAAYEQMKQDLAPFQLCSADVTEFVRDKDDRLKRIAVLDAEIAARRARLALTPPATAPATETTGLDPANDAKVLGDEWVLDGAPTTTGGVGVTVTAAGASWTEKTDAGEGTGTLRVDIAPPKRIRAGQAILVKATLTRQGPYGVIGGWANNNFGPNYPLPQNSDSATDPVDPNAKKQGPHNVAVWHNPFGPSNPAYPVWIEIRVSQWGQDYAPGATIRWTYKLANK